MTSWFIAGINLCTKIFSKQIASWVITALIACGGLGAAHADQRLVLFQKKAQALISKPVHWDHPDHPIGPYIGKFFEEGLSKQERFELLDAHRRVDCIAVHWLMIKGFHNLYPFLKPAFKYNDMRRRLEFEIIRSRGASAQDRCIRRQLLQKFLAKHKLADFPIVDMKYEIDRKWGPRGPKRKETEFDELISIRFGQATGAFCNDYPPAMIDILKSANKPGGLLLTPEEQLYLVERAGSLGHKTAAYDEDVARASKKISDKNDAERIQKAARNRPIMRIANVRGYWGNACQVLRKVVANMYGLWSR